MLQIRLQGLDKVQRLLNPELADRAIARALERVAPQAKSLVAAAAPKGATKKTSGRSYGTAFSKSGRAGIMLGSTATATPKRFGARGGKYKVPYPYPRLLEYSPKSPRKGWLMRAARKVRTISRRAVSQALADIRRSV